MINGHMHWLEALQFTNNDLPPQLVVGNGGTLMIPNYIEQDVFPHIKIDVGREGVNYTGIVERGITMSKFGFGIMERADDLSGYEVAFYAFNDDTRAVDPIDFTLWIPKGPRKGLPNDDGTADPVTPEPSSDDPVAPEPSSDDPVAPETSPSSSLSSWIPAVVYIMMTMQFLMVAF
jgi:hypothetical protein